MLTLTLMTGCVTPRVTTYPSNGLEEMQAGCVFEGGEFRCTEAAISAAGHALIDCSHDLADCRSSGDACERIRDAERMACERKLNKWYRKWYIIAPLSILGGVAIGAALSL